MFCASKDHFHFKNLQLLLPKKLPVYTRHSGALRMFPSWGCMPSGDLELGATLYWPLVISWGGKKSSDMHFDLELVLCWLPQQHTCVSRGQRCSDKCACCHTDIEVTYQFFCLTQSQYADTRPTSPCDARHLAK